MSDAPLFVRPRLSALQIANMCFGFFGIQVGFGLQNANTSRIFQTLGAEIDHLAILWIAAPATGLLVQPIIGFLSDRTWTPIGRRRPYFLVGAILSSIALLLMPNAPILWIAAGALWMLDASINITMEPFRAFVGDVLPEEQRTAGYATQTFFIGVGAVLASAMPWILTNIVGLTNTAGPGALPETVRWAFYIGAACLLFSVLWTVFTSREYPPEKVEQILAAQRQSAHATVSKTVAAPRREGLVGALWILGGGALCAIVSALKLEKELYVLGGLIIAVGGILWLAKALRARGGKPGLITTVVDDVAGMPRTMRGLALVQFFSWFGLFSMWIYTTAAVTAHHYGVTDTTSKAYNDGADWVGILFAVYNGVAAAVALALPLLARALGRRTAHAVNLCAGAVGLASLYVIKDPSPLWISMVGVGVAWASILSAPYAILSSVLPADKMGGYMGIFNIFIVVPQLLAATILGFLLNRFFAGEAIYALLLGAASMLVAAAVTMLVDDPHDPALRRQAL